MSAPPKPWESATFPVAPTVTGQQTPDASAARGAAAAVPPPPPAVATYSDDMNAFGGGFGAYQGGGGPFMSRYGGMGYPSAYGSPYGGYGGYGSYGSYGSYGGVFGGFGAPNGDTDISRFVDDSTRSAFQSVEHIVHAFSSVSMMLESTYFALYNSFRAVLGVGDHLSRVSEQLSHLMNSLSLVRTVRWIIRRTLQVLGMVKTDSAESAWVSASQMSQLELAGRPTTSSWPVLAFFSVVMGAPYLIYRVFGLNSREASKWASGESAHYAAVALYDFIGRNEKELSFQAGAKLRLAPKNLQSKVQGWLVASVDGERIGLVPYNYLKIIGPSEPMTTSVTAVQKPAAVSVQMTCPEPKAVTTDEEISNEGSPNTPNDFVNISMSEIGK